MLDHAAPAILPPSLGPERKGYRLGRLNLEIRQNLPLWHQSLILGISILLGILISGAILVLAGVSAGDLVEEFIVDTLLDGQNLRAVMFQSAPLIFVGLGASIAFRARFWNLGLEGQMIWGAIGATAVSLFEIGPPALRLPLMAIAAAGAGMLWVLLPVFLKMRYRVNEIISTLMLNYVAFYFLLHLLYGDWQDPKDNFPRSPLYASFEKLPEIGWGLSSAFPLAILVTLIAAWLLLVTRAGLYIKFVNANERMARAVGVPIVGATLLAVLVSGGLAALGGFVIASGQEGRLTQSFFQGYGLSGVLIAFLGRNNPIAATIVAFLVSTLFITGQSLQVFYQIPFAMVQLIEAIIVICVAASEFMIRHRVRWVR